MIRLGDVSAPGKPSTATAPGELNIVSRPLRFLLERSAAFGDSLDEAVVTSSWPASSDRTPGRFPFPDVEGKISIGNNLLSREAFVSFVRGGERLEPGPVILVLELLDTVPLDAGTGLAERSGDGRPAAFMMLAVIGGGAFLLFTVGLRGIASGDDPAVGVSSIWGLLASDSLAEANAFDIAVVARVGCCS